jgi:hypothetical protein
MGYGNHARFPARSLGQKGLRRIIGHLIESGEAPSFNITLHRLGGIEWDDKKNRLFPDYHEQ